MTFSVSNYKQLKAAIKTGLYDFNDDGKVNVEFVKSQYKEGISKTLIAGLAYISATAELTFF